MYHLDQLVAFVTAAEVGSFSAAARKIGKGHSTVSTAINNLEITIDAQLFDRSQKYPVLTPIGEQIYSQAKLMLRQNERMLAFANSKASYVEESLSIGLGSLMPFAYIEDELARLGGKFPHTEIKLVREQSDKLQKMTENGELDVVIQVNRGAIADVLDFRDLKPIGWDCVCSPDSELGDHEFVPTELMLSTRQICCSAMLENPLTKVSAEFGIEIWQATDQQDAARMVEEDMGWSYLPSLLVEERVANGTLKCFIPEYNPKQIQPITAVDLLTCPGVSTGPALKYFIEQLLAKE